MFWVGELRVFVTVGVESLVTEGHCLGVPPQVLTSKHLSEDSKATVEEVTFFLSMGMLVKYDNSE